MDYASLPDTLGELYKALIQVFNAANTQTAALDARLIIQERCGHSWSDILADPLKSIDEEEKKNIARDAELHISGKPLSRIYGMREFWGHPFSINEHVLDPRPDTELIIDIARRRHKKDDRLRILDIGTGSGCILISLLHEFPGSTGIGLDVSKDALSIAKHNADKIGVSDRAEFRESNWLSALTPEDDFDLVVSNPPYIRESVIPDLEINVKEFDPILALDGGKDGLQAYKEIFSSLSRHLKEGAIALFEIGYDQGEDLMRLSRESRFEFRNVHPDFAGLPRVVEICRGDK